MTSGVTLLIDAPSLIYRAFFSTPDTVRGPDGSLVNAAHGFFGMLARLVADHDPDRIACAADEDWRPEWRARLIDSYKTHRLAATSVQQQADRELALQVPLIYRLLQLCGIEVIGHPEHEAEDVIGTLAARTPGRVAIVSGDRDLFQLVRDPDVFVLYPRRGVTVVDRVDESYIKERYGIPGRAYRDYAVLRGDSSDGLPGVRGIGDKIAASLLRTHGSLDAIISAASAPGGGIALERVRRDLDYLRRAVQVVTIPTSLPLPDVDLTRPRRVSRKAVDPLAQSCGLSNAIGRLATALERDDVRPAESSP